ncbi:jg2774 [Pararge aegeria aegeria]|uniref:Craniofacial development protein 1 n=2 Tax=Pararge aegeria TaxID=116150 RepID=A0A8S4QR42_9NEOP|nr:jg2774 [Pararge aegeria aegeria]
MSSGSESDDDYVPEEPAQVSEEESADEETNIEYEKEVEHKTKKRKSVQLSNGKKKIKTRNGVSEIQTKEKVEPESLELEAQIPEEDKKREDDLWSKFLEGTDTKPKSTITESNTVKPAQSSTNIPEAKKLSAKEKEDDKERERRIFEFAGETVVVENNVIKERIKTTEGAASVSKLEEKSRSRGSGGLSSVLGQLNKKNTLSTLEKSKLDWNTYKKEEGVEEEVASINKGKTGFLDRRDFLERTDMRQYEIERDLRMSKRSKR